MNPPRRRVSYIVPPPTSHVQRLQLPPQGSQRLGAVNPLLIAYPSQGHVDVQETPSWARHPRHRLGVAALALDTTTCLAGRNAPEGILYSGGRDGLIISRDLGVSMKRRRLRPDTRPSDRWEMLTGWADDAIQEEEDAEDRGTDGDVLGEVTSRKSRSASMSADSAPETQWQTDFSAFKPGVVGSSPSSVEVAFNISSSVVNTGRVPRRIPTGSTTSYSATTIRPWSLRLRTVQSSHGPLTHSCPPTPQ